MAKQTVNIGTEANDGTGDPLRDAFDKLNDNFDEVYANDFVTNARVAADAVDSEQIADAAVDEVHLNATNSPTDGYVLTYDSGGGFTWEQKFDGDITSIVAGDGLTGTSLDSDDATLNVGAGDGITVNDDDVALASSVAGSGLTYSSGVLSVDTIDTDGIAENAVTAAKMEKFDDALAATDAHILVADGNDFTNVALSGDVTITNAGVASLAADSVDYAKLADEFTTVDALSGTAVDWSAAQVFTKTLSANTTLTFSNVSTGMVKDLVISGNYTLTLPSSVKTITGTYDGSATNLIQLVSTNGSTEQWATISQEAS